MSNTWQQILDAVIPGLEFSKELYQAFQNLLAEAPTLTPTEARARAAEILAQSALDREREDARLAELVRLADAEDAQGGFVDG